MKVTIPKSPSFSAGLICIYCFLWWTFFLQQVGFAEREKVGWANRHTLRLTTRRDEDDYDFYLTRASAFVDYHIPQIDKRIRCSVFFEYQANFDTNSWWRKEVGVEMGTSFFEDIFYYAASLQHVWQREENYPRQLEGDGESQEWESRLVITPPLPGGIFKDKLKLRLVDEYTYDFRRGQPTFNEVAIIFDWQIGEHLRLPIGWRHIDRIHDFDSDLLEFSLSFSF